VLAYHHSVFRVVCLLAVFVFSGLDNGKSCCLLFLDLKESGLDGGLVLLFNIRVKLSATFFRVDSLIYLSS
jgi:hypothetical protein